MRHTKRYIAYYRVSTKDQGESGLGLKSQRGTVQGFVASQGGQIVAEYTEVETGTNKAQRPKLAAAIIHAKMSGATLVIAKIDRLSRNVHFLTGLMESGCDFVACDNPHATKLHIHILIAIAEHEAEVIAERTKRALAVKRQEGALLGSARPGHWEAIAVKYGEDRRGFRAASQEAAKQRTQKRVEIDAFFRPIIEKHVSEGLSLSEIARRLNDAGYSTTRGKPWAKQTVSRILSREKSNGPRDDA